MKFLTSLLRRVPKRWLPVSVAVAAVAIPAAVMAWGPDRPTYTMAQPADHVTFDSITDNPDVGDERNFLVIKDASNTQSGGWQDTVTAQPGHEYLVRIFVHNDAAANLNLKATNVRTKVNVPTTTGKSVQLGGFITADNTAPQEIWDSATLTSSSDFNVAYEAGSAVYYNNVFTNGTPLSDSIVTNSGAQLGYDKLDGVIPGCTQYAGYVTFKVKVQGPQTTTFTMSKLVSKHGANQWVKSYAAQPGETVDYLIQYKNTGSTQQDNVVVKDTLPAGESYVAGSTILGNSSMPSGGKVADGVATSTGINIGNYAANANAWVIFSAKVAANDQLPTCGDNKLTNTATVETDNGNKSDTADVTTTKTCVTPPTPKYTCDALTVDTISRTQFKFTATKTVENATFKKFVFVVRDEQGNQLATSGSTDGTFVYNQDKVGKYTVQATVYVDVDGQEKTATSDNCKKPFEVTQQPVENKYVCDSLTIIKKSRDTFEFTVKPGVQGNVSVKEYNFDFGDGKSIIVGAGQETQSHTYAAPGNYNAKVSVTFQVDGKTVTGITSDNCAGKVTVEQPPVSECKPGIPMGDSRCNETPTTPGALPNTSSELAVGGLFGSGALGLSLKAWIASRRNLRDIFKR